VQQCAACLSLGLGDDDARVQKGPGLNAFRQDRRRLRQLGSVKGKECSYFDIFPTAWLTWLCLSSTNVTNVIHHAGTKVEFKQPAFPHKKPRNFTSSARCTHLGEHDQQCPKHLVAAMTMIRVRPVTDPKMMACQR
jgi:hypothetical protein